MKTPVLIIAAIAALVAADVSITDLPSCAVSLPSPASASAPAVVISPFIGISPLTHLPPPQLTCATTASSDASCDISDIGCFCSSDTFATSMYGKCKLSTIDDKTSLNGTLI